MKIYFIYKPTQYDNLQKLYEFYTRSTILMSKKRDMVYHFVNTLIPMSPAILNAISPYKTNQINELIISIIERFTY
ncbi:hypothetical protein BJV85_001291 [Clostridium acetobutylicum]|uniref:hypothetical protein n=1 Tax=Clostridium TaxID=1485 RepID=UPI0009CFB3D3|nr:MULTISPECIES: hypothetical protein [Clostridium]NOV88326.1 hypothetical protein [Clostridium acetobutylicum]NOW13330.1 hypothetical protein [Clostridium acetobutylicum]NRY55707.1 hypothetical protein [Clostridium acetobutylicum]NSA92445.1 hypothetical protein [Clostridium acetobutylicum]OOL99093.1 hypothetical protein CLACE_06120 [Clostridium acetobutylicum]